MISDRHQKKEIRQLEQELPRWQVLVDNITGKLYSLCNLSVYFKESCLINFFFVTRDEHARL